MIVNNGVVNQAFSLIHDIVQNPNTTNTSANAIKYARLQEMDATNKSLAADTNFIGAKEDPNKYLCQI